MKHSFSADSTRLFPYFSRHASKVKIDIKAEGVWSTAWENWIHVLLATRKRTKITVIWNTLLIGNIEFWRNPALFLLLFWVVYSLLSYTYLELVVIFDARQQGIIACFSISLTEFRSAWLDSFISKEIKHALASFVSGVITCAFRHSVWWVVLSRRKENRGFSMWPYSWSCCWFGKRIRMLSDLEWIIPAIYRALRSGFVFQKEFVASPLWEHRKW